jgi:MarR family transcriptional regulator, 2-MHQ and catechol-resistance regulon repressor
VRRAWAAYLELSSTTEWIERRLWTTLGVFGLTREEFRLMLMVYRDGPMTVTEAAEKLGRVRQNVHETIRRMKEFGWVRHEASRLRAAKVQETRLPKARRGRPRQGRKVSRVSLTPQGERLIANVLPKQEQIVKSLMYAVNSTEIDTLARICRKLRKSELFPFWSEMVRQAKEFEASPEAEQFEDE